MEKIFAVGFLFEGLPKIEVQIFEAWTTTAVTTKMCLELNRVPTKNLDTKQICNYAHNTKRTRKSPSNKWCDRQPNDPMLTYVIA